MREGWLCFGEAGNNSGFFSPWQALAGKRVRKNVMTPHPATSHQVVPVKELFSVYSSTREERCAQILVLYCSQNWKFCDRISRMKVWHLYLQHLFVHRKEDREWSRLLSKKTHTKPYSMFRLNTLCSRAAERAGMGLMWPRSSTRSMILPCLLFLVISFPSISVLLLPFTNGSLGGKDTLEPGTWPFCLQERRPTGMWSARERYATCICISHPPSSRRLPPRPTLILIRLSSPRPSAFSTRRSRPLRSRCSQSCALAALRAALSLLSELRSEGLGGMLYVESLANILGIH